MSMCAKPATLCLWAHRLQKTNENKHLRGWVCTHSALREGFYEKVSDGDAACPKHEEELRKFVW